MKDDHWGRRPWMVDGQPLLEPTPDRGELHQHSADSVPWLDEEHYDPNTCPDNSDEERRYPAARCRGCGVVTWTCAIRGDRTLGGDSRLRPARALHHRGCPQPRGRIDVRICAGSDEEEIFGDRLRRPIGDAELEALLAELETDTWS